VVFPLVYPLLWFLLLSIPPVTFSPVHTLQWSFFLVYPL
jgi:hypothetical protein